jgi:hypothetical protein
MKRKNILDANNPGPADLPSFGDWMPLVGVLFYLALLIGIPVAALLPAD